MYFRLKKETNYIEFLKDVGKCKSEVYYETSDGDSLELHSAFCQFIFMDLVYQKEESSDGRIRVTSEQDVPALRAYLEDAHEH